MSTLADLEVLTLEEAAEFLRIPPESVLRLVRASELHGRQVDGNWRFLKDALRDWLRGPSPRESLLGTAGAWRDDSDLSELLEGVYRRRKRPMTESEA
ncbi:MAG: helix-turn-helix domain-containing protein [Isosphaeraceae bacterium]